MRYVVMFLEFIELGQGACRHREGESKLIVCERKVTNAGDDCEAACSEHEPCIGYYKSPHKCWLIPTSETCPDGYQIANKGDGKLATSSDDVIKYNNLPSVTCHKKVM